MGIVKILLNITLHLTPIAYILCAILLFLRRKEGDKSRIFLAISLLIWGLSMFISLIYHYNDSSDAVQEVFSMISLNSTLFFFFVMLLYPIEVISPGNLTVKNMFVLFSSWIFLDILWVAMPEFRKFTAPNEVFLYINEYNVWLRFLVLVYVMSMSFVSFCVPYKYTVSRVDAHWVRWFCLALFINISIYTVWLFTGSDVARIAIQLYCFFFGVVMTYQELYLRIPVIKKDVKPVNPISMKNISDKNNCAVMESPLWTKLLVLLEKEKVWINPDITLINLAVMLGTNRTTLSAMIRHAGYDGFYSLMNTYRIKAYIDIIEHQEITSIQEAFYDVGFRSKTTAFRYFRQETGTTPSDYLQRIFLEKQSMME